MMKRIAIFGLRLFLWAWYRCGARPHDWCSSGKFPRRVVVAVKQSSGVAGRRIELTIHDERERAK